MSVNVGTAVAYLDLDTTKFTSGISSALLQLKSITDSSATTTTKLTALSSAMSSAGSSLTKYVTAPIVGLGTAATKLASDFEASMSKVEAISGSNVEQMEALTDKAIEMGAKTKFSAKESADAFTYMAMAGWKAEDMIDGIGGIMSLAAADGLDLATTSDIVTDALTAFGLQASDSAHFADVLAQASSSANTNVSMLGESFKYVGPVAGALGYSVEDISVALGLMANSGIKASQAGTTLRAAMTRMLKPTDKAAAAMEKYGITLTNEDGTMKSYAEVMDMLRDKLGGLSEAEQAKTATILFGQEAMSGMLAIINASEKDFNSLTDAINNSEGRADSMAETMMDNLGGAIEQLMGALESLAIKIGTALTPTIRKIAESITSIVEKLNTLSDAQVEQIVQIASVVAAIGPLLLIVGKLGSAFTGLMSTISALPAILSSFTAIGTALGPILAVGAAIAGLITVFKKLYEENEQFRTQITEFWENIKENVSGSIESLKSAFDKLKTGLSGVSELLQGTFDSISPRLGDSTMNLLYSIQNAFEALSPIVEKVAKVLGGAFLTAISVAAGVVNGLLKALSPLIDLVASSIDFFVNLGEAFASLFSGDYEGFISNMEEAFENVKEGVASLVESIKELVVGFFDGFWTSLTGLFAQFGVDVEQFVSNSWNSIVEFFVGLKENIVGFVTELGNSLVNFVTVTIPEFVNSVIEWFNNLPYNIGVLIGEMLGHLANFGESALAWAAEAIPALIENIKQFFSTLPEKIQEALSNALQKFIEWVAAMLLKAIEFGTNFVKNIIDYFSTLPDKMYEKFINAKNRLLTALPGMLSAGSSLMNKFWEGLKSVWESISGWFEDVGESIKSFFQGILDGFKNVRESADSLKSSVSGSHANGLSYVPYNGYIAELHEGERVLTKSENEDYNNGRGSGDTFIFNSPKPIDEYEAARLMIRTKEEYEWE